MSDPYSVLGVKSDASDAEINGPTGSWPGSTILTIIRITLWPIWPRRK